MKNLLILFFGLIFNLNVLSMDNNYHGEQFCLHIAIKEQDFNRIDSILDNDAFNVNKQDAQGNTPLHYAVGNQHEIETRLLLLSQADIAIKNLLGKSPSDLETSSIIRLLLFDQKKINKIKLEKKPIRMMHHESDWDWKNKFKSVI